MTRSVVISYTSVFHMCQRFCDFTRYLGSEKLAPLVQNLAISQIFVNETPRTKETVFFKSSGKH